LRCRLQDPLPKTNPPQNHVRNQAGINSAALVLCPFHRYNSHPVVKITDFRDRN